MNNTFSIDKETLLQRAAVNMDISLSEREYSVREKVALTARVLFDYGHGAGLAGQITARGPQVGSYYTQQFGMSLNETEASGLLLVDEDLVILEGGGMPNPANRFHSWVYRARPDVGCIIHTHPLYASALSQLEEPLMISHMDNCILYDDVAFVGIWPGVPFGNEEGVLISEALGSKRAVMLSHHGLLVAGASIEEACCLAVAFERAARMQLLSMSAGVIKPIDPERGREAHRWLIGPKHTRLAFANFARHALRTHPDCLK